MICVHEGSTWSFLQEEVAASGANSSLGKMDGETDIVGIKELGEGRERNNSSNPSKSKISGVVLLVWFSAAR